MLTDDFDSRFNGPRRTKRISATSAAQTVVIVDGHAELMDEIELALDHDTYDIVLVECAAHAYSRIKQLQPRLAILCVNLDTPECLRVLSMLKLDRETQHIPAVVYATARPEPGDEDGEDYLAPPEVFSRRPSPGMN